MTAQIIRSGKMPVDSTKYASSGIHEGSMYFDEAMKVEQDGSIEDCDDATSRRLVRRVDLIMLPLMCVVYGFMFLDKTALSYSSVMGIEQDWHLHGNQYSWLASIFYFGYLAWEFPSGRLLQSLPLAKYLSCSIVLWGVTLVCHAAVKDFGGGVAARLFLGIFETGAMPGFTLITSQWYTKDEQAKRVAIWSSFNGLAQIFGGLVAYGILKNSRGGTAFTIAPWKILFILTGSITILLGFIFCLVVPDNQLNAWWLSPCDRKMAVKRVKVNQQGIGNKKWKPHQFREALTDPLTWAYVVLVLTGAIPNGGLSNFFSLLIEGFGYTAEESLLYGTPGGAVEFACLIGWGFASQKFGHRTLWALVPMTLSFVGSILLIALPIEHRVGRLIGYYLSLGFGVGLFCGISLISSNVAGYTKKTTVVAIFAIAFAAGNIVGPQTFRSKDAPTYAPAKVAIIVCFGISLLDLLAIWLYYKRQNVRKRKVRQQPGYQSIEMAAWLDLTDRENPEFEYSL